MKRIFLVLLGCAAMQAAPIPLGFGDNEGNGALATRTYNTDLGLVTVTAFTNTTGTTWVQSNTTQFGVAQNTDPNGQNLGIGVCNPGEPCSSSGANWQLDGLNNGRDYILVTFQDLINNVVVRIQQTSGTFDADTAWATTTSATAITTANIQALLGGNLVNEPNQGTLTGTGFTNATASWDTRDISVGNNVRQLLFGVNTLQDNDYFKVLQISGDAAVPEPGSIALLGTGLVGLGLVVRRQRSGTRSTLK